MKIIFLISLLVILTASASAVPATPEPIIVNSSQGAIKAKLIGDERGYRIETVDGNVIRAKGKKEYQIQPNNLSGRISKNLAPSMIAFSSTKGEHKAIVILINFPDAAPGNSPSYYQNLIFNSSAKSLNNYLMEVSYSQLSINGNVTSWYAMSQNISFYGADITGVDTNENRADPNTWYIESLAREAVLKADADVDFSRYDLDGDGIVDHIIIVQAGRDQASTGIEDDIWSHSSDIITYDTVKKKFIKGITVDGVKAVNYVMVSGYDPVGVIAHEFGHDLGLIDLYNTASGASVVRNWDIMDSGAWNDHGNTPSHFSAWNKMLLGWLNLTNIAYPQAQIAPRVETSPKAFRIGASQTEYFLVENRQLYGYDAFLPKSGILIWHIDDSVTNNSGAVKKVSLVDASNGAAPLLLAAPYAEDYGYTAFTPFTSPNTSLNNGSASGVKIYDIGASGAFMNLKFGFHMSTIQAGTGTNYTRIQDAINISQDGDTIIVETGNYSENIVINKEISIKPSTKATFYPADSGKPTFSVISNNVSISGFSILGINGSGVGVLAYNVSNITVSGLILSQNEFGFVLELVNKTKLFNNEIYSNNRSGILALFSHDNRILGNSFKSNRDGVELNISRNNMIEDNTIHNNNDSGIASFSGTNNTLTNNDIRNNGAGLKLNLENSSRVYRNNFINNSLNVFDDGSNIWDGGHIIGGNHYSDYAGSDANGDGMGDMPYNISSSLKDNYPFIKPYGWTSKGDVSGDGIVDIVDALFVAQYTVGLRTLNSQQLAAADVNNDSQVNIVDALFIAQYTVGLRQL